MSRMISTRYFWNASTNRPKNISKKSLAVLTEELCPLAWLARGQP